jgi:sporulation protein YlmC with PRC-barrel domain
MRWYSSVVAFALVFGLVFSVQAFAGEKASEHMRPEAKATFEYYKLSKMFDKDLSNTAGEKLGKFQDFLISEEGHFKYAILSPEWEEMSGKWFAIPWKAVKASPEYAFTVDMSRDKLAKAPWFEKGKWEKFDDPEWEKSVYSYYGVEPAFKEGEMPMKGTYRASWILGRTMLDSEGTKVGSVKNVFASRDGYAKYLILSHEGALKEAKAFVPVPWDHTKFSMEKDAVIVKMTKSHLESAPSFGEDEWTKFSDKDWTKSIHSYYEPGETKEYKHGETKEHSHMEY